MISAFFISVGVRVFIEIKGTEFQPAIFVATPQANAKILRFFFPQAKTTKRDWPPTVKVRVNFSHVLLKKKKKTMKFSLSVVYTRVESRSQEIVSHSLESSRATLFSSPMISVFHFCWRD